MCIPKSNQVKTFKVEKVELPLDGEMKECKLRHPVSTKNNCFFRCLMLSGKTKLKLTVGVCNQIRRDYGLKPNNKIPPETARLIAEQEFQCKLYVFNGKNSLLLEGDYDLILFQLEGHYSLMDQIQVCLNCNEAYWHRHDPKRCTDRAHFLARGLHQKRVVSPYQFPTEILGEEKVLHYDLETFTVSGDRSQCYLVGFGWKGSKFFYFAGEKCVHKFVKWIQKNGQQFHYLNAYNGGRFDHSFLVQAYQDLGFKLSDLNLLMANNAVLSAEMFGLRMVDLNRHVVGSLSKALKDFGCKVQKGTFDHQRGRPWEEMDELTRKDALKYLRADVMGLVELSEKVNNGLDGLTKQLGLTHKTKSDKRQRGVRLTEEQCTIKWYDYFTTSQLTYCMWSVFEGSQRFLNTRLHGQFSDQLGIHLPNKKNYPYFSRALYGGRSYPNKRYFESESYHSENYTLAEYEAISDYLTYVDANSLYPTAMLEDYPLGEPVYTKVRVPDKLAIYKVRFYANRNLLTAPIPRRVKVKSTSRTLWDVEDGYGYYTNIDIENAEQCGYIFKVIDGYYWPNRGKIFENYIRILFKIKADAKAQGNSTLEKIAKLMMNGLYGKLGQRPITTTTKIIHESESVYEFLKENLVMDVDDTFLKEHSVLTLNKKTDVDVEKTYSKPRHLGAFVLSYSRRIMLNFMQKINPLTEVEGMLTQTDVENLWHYTDTDSLFFHASLMEKLTADMHDDLGGLKDELKGGKIIRAFFIAPKLYMYEYLQVEKGALKRKQMLVGKGVSRSDDPERMLKVDDFLEMYQGKETRKIENTQFKRKNKGLSKKDLSEGVTAFDIVIKDIGKVLNKHPWNGRHFEGDLSYPWGFEGKYTAHVEPEEEEDDEELAEMEVEI